VNVIIKIKGREAIPVRALPLLAEWGTMNPEKIAGALGRVTDDDRRPLFENLHDMNAFYVEDGTLHPVAVHHWRDHTYRNLKALSDTIRNSEISHEAGFAEWRVKALEILPKAVFVWKDEYETIYNSKHGPEVWANFSDTTRAALIARGKAPPPALNFRPPIANEHMETLVRAALDAIGRATNNAEANTHEQHSSEANTLQQVEQVPPDSPMPDVGAFGSVTSDNGGPVVANEIDFSVVATREELIDAFGKFTGMNMTWFNNLTDAPKLKAARKYTGKGGRHSAEPLFCPYEVMQWLADPKRKKGKPLNGTTAWRLLKSSFGKVYNQYSIGDPNPD
jgi:hypothetical protein